jgi:serine/threonine protein kinase
VFEHHEFLIIVYRVKYEMNLREYIVKNKSINEEEIRYLFSQFAVALNDSHKASIIVRQLNPELIFINPADLHIIICDLSCATLKGELSRPIMRSCIGFIAPEILEDKPYTIKSDSFSLGVIMYMMYSRLT